MTQIETLRLALEALENSVDLVREDAYNAEELYGNYPARQGKVRGLKVLADDHEKAITAIKAALEAKDEPVVWNEGAPAMLPKQKEGEAFIVSYEPKLEAKDEPVACVIDGDLYFHHEIDWEDLAYQGHGIELLYATPPQRKPLTNQQIAEILERGDVAESNDKVGWYVLPYSFSRAIEAAHGIKGQA